MLGRQPLCLLFIFKTMREIPLIIGIGEVVGVIVLAVLYVRSRLPKQTIEQQAQLIESLQARVQDLEKGHVNNERVIAELTGQLKVYKEIPLEEIAKSLKNLENLPEKIEQVLKDNK